MQYRTYKLIELAEPYTWTYYPSEGDPKTFCNYDTLVYAAGGAVAKVSIDNDYLMSNNSTVYIAAPTSAVAGQIIVLIDDAGAYDCGIISSVDNTNLQILYKGMLEIFNDNMLNPMRVIMNDEDQTAKYLYDGVEDTAQILATYLAAVGTDKYRRMPIRIRTSGGGSTDGKFNVPAIWSYADNTINIHDWLMELFNKHNVIVQCRIVFETARAYVEIYISCNQTGGKIIKNNIHGMQITHAEDSSANATVCTVIDQETLEVIGTYYLQSDNTVTTDPNSDTRVVPYKLVVATFDSENEDGATAQTVAEENLLYSDFNHYISIVIDRNSAMYPTDLNIGDAVIIVPELQNMTAEDAIIDDFEDKIMRSIYTGRKEDSENSQVTLIFGKIRINYTDLIQMQQQKLVRA